MTDTYVELRISEAAERTGFDASTIRYYERIGLIPEAERNDSGHRIYSRDDVERLKLVASAKSLGLTLEDIKRFLSQWERGECPSARTMLKQLVATKLRDLRHRIGELTHFHDALFEAYNELGSGPAPDTCGPGCGCDVAVTVSMDHSVISVGREPARD